MRRLRSDAAVRPAAAPELVVRPACRHADADALERLAARGGARALHGGHVLVAEWAGRIVAAVSMHDGRAVADPSATPLDAVAILRRHTSAARPARARGRASRCRGCLASRPAASWRGSPDRGTASGRRRA